MLWTRINPANYSSNHWVCRVTFTLVISKPSKIPTPPPILRQKSHTPAKQTSVSLATTCQKVTYYNQQHTTLVNATTIINIPIITIQMMHTALRVASSPGHIYNAHNSKQLRACIDSAASSDMIPQKSYFESITYYDTQQEDISTVLLGDESSRIPVKPVYVIQGNIIKKRSPVCPRSWYQSADIRSSITYEQQRMLLSYRGEKDSLSLPIISNPSKSRQRNWRHPRTNFIQELWIWWVQSLDNPDR